MSLVCAGSAGRIVEAELVEGAAVWGRNPFPVPAHENMFATRRHTPASREGMGFVLAHPATEDNDGNNREGEDEDSSHRQHLCSESYRSLIYKNPKWIAKMLHFICP